MRLYLGDSAEILKGIEDASVDLTVTSPPYDDLRDYNGYIFDFQSIARELWRVTKPGGVLVWVVGDQTINGSESGSSFKQALFFKDIGFNLHDTMIWVKDATSFPETVRYPQIFEYMFVLSKGKPRTFNPIKDRRNAWAGANVHGTFRKKNGETVSRSKTWSETEIQEFGSRYNVWKISAEKHSTSNHPAVFPVAIPKDHIRTWSNRGDVVLDPFMGSGTTGVACVETGRDFIGVEISEEYFNFAKKRIEDADAQIRFI